jgi:hypothetical protein
MNRISWKGYWKSLLALPIVIIFTIYDIWMVEGLFRKLQIWEEISIYHQATFRFLFPTIIIFFGLILRSWRFVMYSVVGIYCGWLDMFYYWLQGKSLPNVYTWLVFSPTSSYLIMFATIVLLLAISVDLLAKTFIHKYQRINLI